MSTRKSPTKKTVLRTDSGLRSAASVAALAGIGGITLDRIIDSIMPKESGKPQARLGPPTLTGKRLERVQKADEEEN